MILERKLIYEIEVEKMNNIISTERLKCVFSIINEHSIEYVTVSLPKKTEDTQASYKF